MYYTAGSSDGPWVAAAVVHKEEEIIIIHNDSAFVLDAEMTAHTSSARERNGDKVTIHRDSIFDNCKQTK